MFGWFKRNVRRHEPQVPFDGDTEIADVFFNAVEVAKELAASADDAFMPFSIGQRNDGRVMSSFPIPPEEMVETATRICRESESVIWCLVWDGYLHSGDTRHEALFFRTERTGSGTTYDLVWRYNRSPEFSMIGNPAFVN